MKKMEMSFTKINEKDVIATSGKIACLSTSVHYYFPNNYDASNVEFKQYNYNGSDWDESTQYCGPDFLAGLYGVFDPLPSGGSWYVNTSGNNHVPCNDDHTESILNNLNEN